MVFPMHVNKPLCLEGAIEQAEGLGLVEPNGDRALVVVGEDSMMGKEKPTPSENPM